MSSTDRERTNPRRQCACVCFLSVENASLGLFAHDVLMQYGFSATMRPIREAILKVRIYTTKELQWYHVPAESRDARAIPNRNCSRRHLPSVRVKGRIILIPLALPAAAEQFKYWLPLMPHSLGIHCKII